MLRSDELRQIIDLVKDETSSLILLQDNDSHRISHSIVTECSSTIDVRFEFDREILNSKVYQMAIRSNMRQGLSKKENKMTQRHRSPSENLVDIGDSGRSIETGDDAQNIRKNITSPKMIPRIKNRAKMIEAEDDAETVQKKSGEKVESPETQRIWGRSVSPIQTKGEVKIIHEKSDEKIESPETQRIWGCIVSSIQTEREVKTVQENSGEKVERQRIWGHSVSPIQTKGEVKTVQEKSEERSARKFGRPKRKIFGLVLRARFKSKTIRRLFIPDLKGMGSFRESLIVPKLLRMKQVNVLSQPTLVEAIK